MRTPLFEGTIASGATRYVSVPIHNGVIGSQIAWKDATSSATITLELTSLNSDVASDTSTTAWHWKDSGETITGPAASAAGSTLVHLENVRQRRGRFKIVAAADCSFVIMDGAVP